jgi:hypothetical protein
MESIAAGAADSIASHLVEWVLGPKGYRPSTRPARAVRGEADRHYPAWRDRDAHRGAHRQPQLFVAMPLADEIFALERCSLARCLALTSAKAMLP